MSYSGFTALHYAVLTDDRAMVEWLLENGADPTVENHRGLKPSHYSNSSEILSLLQEYTNKVHYRDTAKSHYQDRVIAK